jgi:hypothetical protein
LHRISGQWRKQFPTSLTKLTIRHLLGELRKGDLPEQLKILRLGTFDSSLQREDSEPVFFPSLEELELKDYSGCYTLDVKLHFPTLKKLALPDYTYPVQVVLLPTSLTSIQLGNKHYKDSYHKESLLYPGLGEILTECDENAQL